MSVSPPKQHHSQADDANATGKAERRKNAKILLIDDHPIVRQGLAQLINQEPDLVVCGEASSIREALDQAAETQPDLAVVDISLRDGSGVELIKEFQRRHPQLLCFALSMFDEAIYAMRVLRAGGRGYMMKEEVSKKVVAAIRKILDGDVFVSDSMATRLLGKMVLNQAENVAPLAVLSDRELEILTLIGRGLTTRGVAEKLFISVKTVEAHKERLKQKLSLNNATELARYAVQYTVDHPPPTTSAPDGAPLS